MTQHISTHLLARLSATKLLLCLSLLASGCTAGNIVTSTGAQWIPSGTAQVSFVSQFNGNTYTVQVAQGVVAGTTSFAFDPYAPSSSTNNAIQLPIDDYTLIVTNGSSRWVTEGFKVHVDPTQSCPYSDALTGQSGINCALFTLKLFPCGTNLFSGPLSDGSIPLTNVSCSWPQTISTCPGGATAVQKVAVDCSSLTNPISIANCRIYAQDVACKVAPAYKTLTNVALESRCPTFTYKIVDENTTNPCGESAGGCSPFGSCTSWYSENYSVNPGIVSDPNSTRYGKIFRDKHEILHQIQYTMSSTFSHTTNHPLFGSSMTEVSRQLGEITTAQAITKAQHDRTQGMNLNECRGAQITEEENLYIAWLQNGAVGPNIVTSVYNSIQTWYPVLGWNTDGDAVLDDAFVSNDTNAASVLVAKGCPFQ